jgi:hypothetical protein
MDLVEVISTFGKAFNDNRIIAIVWIVLPVIGLLERFGLQQRAAAVIRHAQRHDGKLLLLYLLYRQVTRRSGFIRPPATRRPCGRWSRRWRWRRPRSSMASWTKRAEKVKSYSAATDNVGLFFGEDIFFAIGSIVLIQQTLATYGYQLARWNWRSGRYPTPSLRSCPRRPPADAGPDASRSSASRRDEAALARRNGHDHARMAVRHGGLMFAAFSLLSAFDRSHSKRFGNAAFWG